MSQPFLSVLSTYQNEPAVSAAPTTVARRLAIVDYRNKTYFRIKRCSKLEPAVLIRGNIRNVYDKKVAKGTLDSSHLSVEILTVVPRDWCGNLFWAARKGKDVTEEKIS
jgi:hypothetical protein